MKWLLIYFIVCWILPLLLVALLCTYYVEKRCSYFTENVLAVVSIIVGSCGFIPVAIILYKFFDLSIVESICDIFTKLFNKILPNLYKPWYKDDRHYVKFNGKWCRVSQIYKRHRQGYLYVLLTSGENFIVDENVRFVSETLYKSKLFKIMEEKWVWIEVLK